MKSITRLIIGLFLLSTLAGLPALAAAAGPQEQLQKSVSRILDILRDDGMPIEAKKQQITDLVRQRFDLRVMSQYVLGPQWRTTSDEQRERFVTLFSDLLEASYVDRISDYTDEKVDFVGEQIREDRAAVETRVLTGSKEIPIEYRLVNQDGEWLVYDVVIEKVSLVRNYRSSYREIARKEGIDKLLSRMEDKLKEIRQGGQDAAS